MTSVSFRFFVTALVTVIALSGAHAQSLTIKDTSGEARFVGELSDLGTIEMEVSLSGQPAHGTEVYLQNEGTGETVRAVTENGIVRFEGLTAGSWTVSSADPALVFSSISVVSGTAVAGIAIGSVPAIVIGGAAITGAGFLIDEATKGDPDPSPSS